jgi:hypothetical protein
MAYPTAPWTLKGRALQTLHLLNIERVRRIVPSEVALAAVWPGKTIGIVYAASYGPGSVLEYDELIVAVLARYAGKTGFWITHAYVDNSDAMSGGREIWGVPKELAQFTWEEGKKKKLIVRQGYRVLCSLSYSRTVPLLRFPISLACIGRLNTDLLWFKADLKASLGIARGKLNVPGDSPIGFLGFGKAWLSYHYRNMSVLANAPTVVGQLASKASRS